MRVCGKRAGGTLGEGVRRCDGVRALCKSSQGFSLFETDLEWGRWVLLEHTWSPRLARGTGRLQLEHFTVGRTWDMRSWTAWAIENERGLAGYTIRNVG